MQRISGAPIPAIKKAKLSAAIRRLGNTGGNDKALAALARDMKMYYAMEDHESQAFVNLCSWIAKKDVIDKTMALLVSGSKLLSSCKQTVLDLSAPQEKKEAEHPAFSLDRPESPKLRTQDVLNMLGKKAYDVSIALLEISRMEKIEFELSDMLSDARITLEDYITEISRREDLARYGRFGWLLAIADSFSPPKESLNA
jgi:hypothetical protein